MTFRYHSRMESSKHFLLLLERLPRIGGPVPNIVIDKVDSPRLSVALR